MFTTAIRIFLLLGASLILVIANVQADVLEEPYG